MRWNSMDVNFGRWWRTGRPGVLQSTGSQRIRDDSANKQQTQLYSGVDTLLCTHSFCRNPYSSVCLPTDGEAPTLPTGCLPPILSPHHSQLCIVQPNTYFLIKMIAIYSSPSPNGLFAQFLRKVSTLIWSFTKKTFCVLSQTHAHSGLCISHAISSLSWPPLFLADLNTLLVIIQEAAQKTCSVPRRQL